MRNCRRRRIYHSFNPQGVGIVAASILSFGTDEQKQKWAVPILRGEMTASVGMSEPGAGSDLASLRTKAVRSSDGDHFIVNGQKVWTSGAHHADVLLTFVRTDPDVPKHKGISVLLIPTETAGLVRRPFPTVCHHDDLDFNEVFFTDVRVPLENLVGPLNGGWRVANGALGHERTMMWMQYADRLHNLVEDFRPVSALDRDRYATLLMDHQALKLLGSAAVAQAARGEEDMTAISVLKVLGSEAERDASEQALSSVGVEGLRHPATTSTVCALRPGLPVGELDRTLLPQLCRHHRRRHLGDPAQHHRARSGPADELSSEHPYLAFEGRDGVGQVVGLNAVAEHDVFAGVFG